MNSKMPCFLGSPEWRDLLLQGPAEPFQTSQSRILTLRLRLHAIMVDIPGFVLECSAIDERRTSQSTWEARLDLLMRRALTKFEDVKKWLTIEAEPFFQAHASVHENIEKYMHYPDMISGVLDAVANTLLLILDQVFRFLYQSRLQHSSQAGSSTRQWLEGGQLLSDPEDADRGRRVATAFNFVEGISSVAAQPLQLGLQALQSSIPSCSINERR